MSATPVVARKGSYKIPVEAGKKYAWCACGMSQTQPFCDGTHKGSTFSPVVFTADVTKEMSFCGCKHSKLGAFCDGTHRQL